MALSDSTRQGKLFDTGPRFKTCMDCKKPKPIGQFSPYKDDRPFVPRSFCRQCRPGRIRRFKYKITNEEYERLLVIQSGLCAICGKEETGISGHTKQVMPLSVDHDHVSGRVRGLLCRQCNFGIGSFADNPMLLRAAASYIERPGGHSGSQ